MAPQLALLLPLLLPAPSPSSAAIQEPVRQEDVDAAIDRGVEFLLGAQLADGAWPYAGDRARAGSTALVAYALLKCGVARDHPAIHRGIARLSASHLPGTYDAACMLLALTAHDPHEHREWIEELSGELAGWQRREGDWGYPSGADLSNTQYAALGLWAAARAGIELEAELWERLADGVLDYSNGRGGFSYTGNDSPTETMTAAGVGTLALCDAQLSARKALTGELAERVRRSRDRGLDWLGRRADVLDARRGSWPYYRLYGIERIGAWVGVHEIGELDWYDAGAASLLREQGPEGGWDGPGGSEPLIETSFALLFLRRATSLPLTGGRYASGRTPHFATRDPEAAIAVNATGTSSMTIWVSGWGASERERLEWPRDRGRGLRVLAVEYYVDGALASRVAGDPGKPAGTERFAIRHAFEEAGSHRVQVAAQVLAPPRDGMRTGENRTLVSPPLEVTVDEVPVKPTVQRLSGADLSSQARARATASSTFPRTSGAGVEDRSASRAIDRRMRTAWLARPSDPRPTLEIAYQSPQRADRVLIHQARSVPFRPGALGRALEVRVRVNRDETYTVRMHPDELEVGVLDLPRPTVVRRLELSIPWKVDGEEVEAAGFAEVELVRRGE